MRLSGIGNTLLRRAVSALLKKKRWLPYNRAGDRVWLFLHFVNFHGRMPDDRAMFNDALYRLFVSRDMRSKARKRLWTKNFRKTSLMACWGIR